MKKRFLVLTMAFTMFASQFGSPIMAMARGNVVASNQMYSEAFGEVPGSLIPTRNGDQIVVYFKNEDGTQADWHGCNEGGSVAPSGWFINNLVSSKNGWGQPVTDHIVGWRSSIDGQIYSEDELPAVTEPVSYYVVFESSVAGNQTSGTQDNTQSDVSREDDVQVDNTQADNNQSNNQINSDESNSVLEEKPQLSSITTEFGTWMSGYRMNDGSVDTRYPERIYMTESWTGEAGYVYTASIKDNNGNSNMSYALVVKIVSADGTVTSTTLKDGDTYICDSADQCYLSLINSAFDYSAYHNGESLSFDGYVKMFNEGSLNVSLDKSYLNETQPESQLILIGNFGQVYVPDFKTGEIEQIGSLNSFKIGTLYL